MAGLTNDERCLIHNVRVKKHCPAGVPKELWKCIQIRKS